MSDLKSYRMPESLLWLSNELYWKQNLSPKAAVAQEEAGALPFRTIPTTAPQLR